MRLRRKPWRRIAAAVLGQRTKTLECPDMPLLTGKIALITGSTSGIGKATARGLLRRGARLIMLCRNGDKAEVVQQEFIADGLDARNMHFVTCDLADMASISDALSAIDELLGTHQIDILIENAAIMARRFETNRQGIEISFATNVLGHFALRRGLMRDGALNPHARIIVLTGETYAMARQCTPHFRWRGRLGGLAAYHRSKLGNFWIGRELQRRHPDLNVYIVHPGLVATNLGGYSRGFLNWAKTRLMIHPRDGAQMALLCATQDDLSHGSYYHNVYGEIELDNTDPALNDFAARRLWENCMELTQGKKQTATPISYAS